MGGERIEQGKADRDAAVRRITMKYKVTIDIYYSHQEHFYFDDPKEAMQFLILAVEHLGPQVKDQKTEFRLELVTEEEVDDAQDS